MLEGIPERKAGEESIDVEFSYNQNGILDVKATIVSTHKDMAVNGNNPPAQENTEQ